MAPFAFLNHHSFRRGASSQLSAVPESGAHLSTDMGATPSRLGPNAVENRKIRPRSSSLNLLKRSRTPSGNAAVRVSCPPQSTVDTTTLRDGDTEIEYTTVYEPVSEITIRAPSDSTTSSKSKKSDSDEKSLSDVSSTGTATRVTPPSTAQKDASTLESDDRPGGMHTPVPPSPPRTPQNLLPTPHVLTEDSPTKYGLRIGNTPSPERSLTAAQRQKMTGTGLFMHAVNHQKSATSTPVDQARSGAADPNFKFSYSSPTLALPGKSHPEHTNSLPNRKVRSNRRNPFKDAPLDHVAHALPLRRSQRACFRDHDAWRRMGRNLQHPVACAVCDGYKAPGDDFMVCAWCEMHVCGECYSTFNRSGVTVLMGDKSKG